MRFVEESNTDDILWLYLVKKYNRNSKFCALLKKMHISVFEMKVNLTILNLRLRVEIFFEDSSLQLEL